MMGFGGCVSEKMIMTLLCDLNFHKFKVTSCDARLMYPSEMLLFTLDPIVSRLSLEMLTLIDRKVLSSIYPAMNSSFLLSQLCLIKVNHLFTPSHFHLFQIDVM